MLNSVGLQGPGVDAWRAPRPARRCGGPAPASVASIWGRTVDEYAKAAERARRCRRSSPSRSTCRARTSTAAATCSPSRPSDSAAVVARGRRRRAAPTPVWAKLTAACTSIVEVAEAVADAGAEAVVCVNTLLGMAIDVERAAYRLGSGAGGGGLSGPAHPPGRRAGRARRARRAAVAADRRRRRRVDRRRTPSSCCWRGRARSGSGRRRSPTPGRAGGCWTGWRSGARTTASVPWPS